jgi:glutathione S-transferase
VKLYNSIGPNPHVVRMFLAEKGISVPMQDVDLMAGDNRKPEHLVRNPHGQMPTLELDDGTFISEILAICEYVEDTHPTPPLIGANPKEKAQARMWTRRVDLNICEPIANGFRFSQGLRLFQNRIVTVPEAAEGLKKIAQDRIKWLDVQIAERDFLCGKRFTLADILLFCFLDFGTQVGQPLDPENKHVVAWFERVKERPSAKA